MRRDADRLRASELLAERGWGKAPAFAAIEEADPLGLEDAERAAEEFRAKFLRLAEAGEQIDSEGPGQRQPDRRQKDRQSHQRQTYIRHKMRAHH